MDDTDLTVPYGQHARTIQTSLLMKDGRSLDRMDVKATVGARLGDENVKMLSGCQHMQCKELCFENKPLLLQTQLRILKAVEVLTFNIYIYISAYQHAQTYCTCGPGLRLTVKTSQSPVSVLLLPLRSGKPLSAKAHPRY